jgi:hypothetical protein
MPGDGRRALYGCRRQRGRTLSGPALWRVRCATGGTHHDLLKGAALVRGARDERERGPASEERALPLPGWLAGWRDERDASCAALRCAASCSARGRTGVLCAGGWSSWPPSNGVIGGMGRAVVGWMRRCFDEATSRFGDSERPGGPGKRRQSQGWGRARAARSQG